MRRLMFAAVVFGTASLLACGQNGNGGPDGGAESDPLACGDDHADVTAEQLFNDIVQPQCATCHFAGAGTATNGDLEMETVEKLRATAGKASAWGTSLRVVDPGRSENSTMFLKVQGGTVPGGIRGPNGENVGARMPNAGPELSDAQKKMFKDWICTGAD